MDDIKSCDLSRNPLALSQKQGPLGTIRESLLKLQNLRKVHFEPRTSNFALTSKLTKGSFWTIQESLPKTSKLAKDSFWTQNNKIGLTFKTHERFILNATGKSSQHFPTYERFILNTFKYQNLEISPSPSDMHKMNKLLHNPLDHQTPINHRANAFNSSSMDTFEVSRLLYSRNGPNEKWSLL